MIFFDFLKRCQSSDIRFSLIDNQLKVEAPKGALTPDIVSLLREFKPKIIAQLSQSHDVDNIHSIQRITRDQSLPISFGQEQLWLIDQIDSEIELYSFTRLLKFNGNLNVDGVKAAFNYIFDRHESLRTVIESNLQEPVQVINAHESVDIDYIDLSHDDNKHDKTSVIQQDFLHKKFNLGCGPMLKLQLIRLDDKKYQLLLNIHHIVSDGWSLGILVNEFTALYCQYISNEQLYLPELEVQYADYSYWQRKLFESGGFDASLSFWQEKLQDCPNVHSLPLDKPRPTSQSYAGSKYKSQLGLSTLKALNALSKQSGCTLFMVLEGIFALLISRYSNEDDVIVGTVVANREQVEVEGVIGYFSNLLPLRHRLDLTVSFLKYLSELKDDILSAFSHQSLPFEQLVQKLLNTRDQGFNPIVQICFILQNNDIPELELPGVNCVINEPESHLAMFDLQLEATERDTGLELSWEFATDIFETRTIERMALHFELLIESIVENPSLAMNALNFCSYDEITTQLMTWNDTTANYSQTKCLHQLFETQAIDCPDSIAVHFQEQTFTYSQLNHKANQLAHYLIEEKGITTDTLVGLCLERSLDMMVGILAVLKAGGAYVPLDPSYPIARLDYMLKDANLDTVITQLKFKEKTPVLPEQALYLDSEEILIKLQSYSINNIDAKAMSASQLAYVIYTSGSTGNPKGVMVEHLSVNNFISSMSKRPGLNGNDRLLAVTSTSFDIHVLELFLPITRGAQLVIASEEAAKDANMLVALIKKHDISIMQATPITWKMLLEVNWAQNTPFTALCGGEALPWNLAQRLLSGDNITLWNMYGPTETTVWSTLHQVNLDDGHIYIGKPIDNTQCYVISQGKTLLPVGSVGELYIGGKGLTRGYYNRQDLTDAAFIENPFYDQNNANSSEYIYKTGDLARWLPDGALECLGRLDTQIKIRGYRVELGDIERQINEHSAIKDSIVMVDKSHQEEQLVSYVVPQPSIEPPLLESQLSFSLFYFGGDNYDHGNKYELYTNAAIFADRNGFEAVWTPERHFDAVGSLYPNPAILNAALAGITTNIKLRAGSVVLPLHDPIRVAEEWAVVDNLSQGRVGMAIASGWHNRDFVLAPSNYENRKGVMLEGINDLKQLWQGNTVTRINGSGDEVAVSTFPRPLQETLPLWLTAAGNPETFIEAGRQGAHLLTHVLGQNLEELESNIQLYKNSLEQHGYDKSKATITLMIHTYIGEDLAETLEEAKQPFLQYLLAHIGLLIPALKGLGISTDDLTKSDLEEIAEFSYERLTKSVSLIGTPSSTLDLVNNIKATGVTEIACLIDWMDASKALKALSPLNQLKSLSTSHIPERSELIKHCKARLPQFMVPDHFIIMENFPLTPNGKINRKALPKLELSKISKSYIAPTSKVEETLCLLWQSVLKIDRVGISDDFFELGGNSLLATTLIANINNEFNVELPLKTLFNSTTIATFSSQLDIAESKGKPSLISKSSSSKLLPSYSQQRLWILDKIDGGSAHYNTPLCLSLSGQLNIEALTDAMSCIIKRHESLRTSFEETHSGLPKPIIRDFSSLTIPFFDISLLPPQEREADLAKLISIEANKAFDLSEDIMLRAQLVQMSEQTHMLLVTMHHIASDGWSMRILVDELSTLYSAYLKGDDNPLPPLDIQYSDYALWQRDWLQGETLDRQLEYWERQLADLPVVHNLPLDRVRPKQQTFNGASYSNLVSLSVTNKLNELCQGAGATLFMGLHAAFSVILARYSNETDIVVGSPIANREQAEVANLIGFFVNTLVLRSDLSEQPSFNDLLLQSKKMLLNAYAHQQIPFEQIVEKLQPERSLSHSALFQVMLVLHNTEEGNLELPGLTLSPVEQSINIAKYDLTLNVEETSVGLKLNWEYSTDLFDSETINRLANHFTTLINGLVHTPDLDVFSVDMLPAKEKTMQSVTWNDTQASYPQARCIHEFFEQQVKQTPEAVAAIYGEAKLTYSELNSKANQLAHYLREERGVGPDTLVGLCVERSLDMVVGIMGILKAGGAYVPLDPEYPEERIAYMIKDAQLTTVLTCKNQGITLENKQELYLDDDNFIEKLGKFSYENIKRDHLNSTCLAYVIYTSGSTGKPKGVLVEHQSVINYLTFANSHYCSGIEGSVVSSTLSFDATVTSVLTPLVNGKFINILPSGQNDIELLAKILSRLEQPHLFKLTPAHLESIIALKGDSFNCDVKHVFVVGGEQLATRTLIHWQDKLFTKSIVVNEFGPTEATVGCSFKKFYKMVGLRGDKPGVDIGKPIQNYQLYVLNQSMQHCPNNIVGELHIGGVGLARGYLNRADLTAEKFIDNPYFDETNPNSSKRLYKTGDLVRWLPDGNLEYLGRIDHQVKIRGFRIELGEIEHALSTHETINDAVVVAASNDGGDKQLVAYVVTADADELNQADDNHVEARHEFISKLRSHLKITLPEHMVPSAFMLMESFPLTPNGKVNRKALPSVDVSSQQGVYVAPSTETEKVLCEIWQDLLDVEQVGITDNFFHLGGDSMKVLSLISKMREVNISTESKNIFIDPTIEGIAKVTTTIKTNLTANQQESNFGKIPLSPWQKVFFSKNKSSPNMFSIAGLYEMDTTVDLDCLSIAFNSVLNKHDALRTCFSLKYPYDFAFIKPAESIDTSVHMYDFTSLTEENKFVQMEKELAKLHKELNIEQGHLMQVALCKLGGSLHDRIFINIHHLVCDKYSKEIIYEDLNKAYQQAMLGQKPQLSTVSASSLQAANQISEYAKSPELLEQLDYWKAIPWGKISDLQFDFNYTDTLKKGLGQKVLTQSLTQTQTSVILKKLPDHYNINIVELLTYLAVDAQQSWLSGEWFRVNVVTFGRDYLENQYYADLSRTVGWYSMTKFLFFNYKKSEEAIDNLLNIQKQIDAAPGKGVGIRFLLNGCEDPQARNQIEPVKPYLLGQKVMTVHYKGIVGGDVNNNSSEKSSDSHQDLTSKFAAPAEDFNIYRIVLSASIKNGCLEMRWIYNENIYKKQTIDMLSLHAKNALTQICASVINSHVIY